MKDETISGRTDMNKHSLLKKLCPPLDRVLTQGLLREFITLEQRFVLGDWEPATLDGGQIAELASRIVYHIDAGNLNRRKGVDACLKYVEDQNNSNAHAFPHRRSALHLCRVIRTVYKFRSQRGAIHIDPDYTANELDASLIIANVRWIVSEILRIFWSGSTRTVADAVRDIVQYRVPAIFKVDEGELVLRTDCTVEEEILLLLHNAGQSGWSRTLIGRAVPKSPAAVTNALKHLAAPSMRQIVKLRSGDYILTPNGTKRVLDELSTKLSLA